MISPFVSTPEITDVTPYVSPVGVLVITSSDDYTRVAEHLLTITAFRRQVQAFFKPLKDAAHAAHKSLCDREKETLAPADADEQRIKRALVEYTTAQDRIRHAEEARLMVEQRQAEEARRLHGAGAPPRPLNAPPGRGRAAAPQGGHYRGRQRVSAQPKPRRQNPVR